MMWGRAPRDGDGAEESRAACAGNAEWLAREVARLAEDNDRLLVALEDVSESLAWRYAVRSNRGLNRDERACVDRALMLLADHAERSSADSPETDEESAHPGAAAPAREIAHEIAGETDGPRLRLVR